MKCTSKQYAAALRETLEGKTGRERKEILRRLVKVLLKNRDFSKRAAVLKEYERQCLRAQDVKKIILDSAAPVPQKLKHEIQKILGGKLSFSERIDPVLLAGIKILVNDEIMIDASGRGRIKHLFKHHGTGRN